MHALSRPARQFHRHYGSIFSKTGYVHFLPSWHRLEDTVPGFERDPVVTSMVQQVFFHLPVSQDISPIDEAVGLIQDNNAPVAFVTRLMLKDAAFSTGYATAGISAPWTLRSPILEKIGIAVSPGQITETLIPFSAYSFWRLSDSPTTANFVVL